jgi:hypothetical protein
MVTVSVEPIAERVTQRSLYPPPPPPPPPNDELLPPEPPPPHAWISTREPVPKEGLVHVPDDVKVCTLMLDEFGELTHDVPLEVSKFPDVPTAVNPVPPLATGSVPVTPVVKGKPVAFVKVADVGVPKIGVTKVGEVDSTVFPVPVEVVTPVPPAATANVPKLNVPLPLVVNA